MIKLKTKRIKMTTINLKDDFLLKSFIEREYLEYTPKDKKSPSRKKVIV